MRESIKEKLKLLIIFLYKAAWISTALYVTKSTLGGNLSSLFVYVLKFFCWMPVVESVLDVFRNKFFYLVLGKRQKKDQASIYTLWTQSFYKGISLS